MLTTIILLTGCAGWLLWKAALAVGLLGNLVAGIGF